MSSSHETIQEKLDFFKKLCEPVKRPIQFWKINSESSFRKLGKFFWSSGQVLSEVNPKTLESVLMPIISKICENNAQTSNNAGIILTIGRWLIYWIEKSGEKIDTKEDVATPKEIEDYVNGRGADVNKGSEHVVNGLVFLRLMIHHVLSSSPSPKNEKEDVFRVSRNFITLPFEVSFINENYSVIDYLCEVFFKYLTYVRVNNSNFLIHFEILNCLVVCFSSSLYFGYENRKNNIFLESFMKIFGKKDNEINVGDFIYRMLTNLITFDAVSEDLVRKNKGGQGGPKSFIGETGGMLYSFFWKFLSFPSYAYTLLFGGSNQQIENEYLNKFFRNKEIFYVKKIFFVLEMLIFYRKYNLDGYKNVFLLNLNKIVALKEPSFKFYNSLVNICIRNFDEEERTIFFYVLLNENVSFKKFIVTQIDCEVVVNSILKKLYNCKSTQEFSNHLWILIILMMILTQEKQFNVNINTKNVKYVEWFTERKLYAIQLSSVMTVVLTQLVVNNINNQKEMYLNTNALCCIGNTSPFYNKMSLDAARKIVVFMKIIVKRYESANTEELKEERETYMGFIRLICEIINTMLVHRYPFNYQLIYQLILEKELFKTLVKIAGEEVKEAMNIKIIVEYFEKLMKSKKNENETWEVNEINEMIVESAKEWNTNLLGMRPFPPLKYSFKEEDTVEEFFLPFLWSLIILSSDFIDWNVKKIAIELPLITEFLDRSEGEEEEGEEEEENDGEDFNVTNPVDEVQGEGEDSHDLV